MNAQKLADFICQQEGIEKVRMHVKNVKRGRAMLRSRYVSVPKWAQDRSKTYFIYYAMHEVAHFIERDKHGSAGHGIVFKSIEVKLLKQFGITIKYGRAYPKKLYLKGTLAYERGKII